MDFSPASGSEPSAELVRYRQLLAEPEGLPPRRADVDAEAALCQWCYDLGFVVDHRLRPGDPHFGERQVCTACGSAAEQRVARLFRQSIPPHFASVTFESYPVTAATAPLLQTVRDWVRMPVRGSLLLAGRYGVGKTGLAICALRERVADTHCDALFLTTPALLDRIRETYNRERGEKGERESDVMDAAKSVSLLVLDDLGAERVTDWVAEKLFTLVNHRHDYQLATIFTSNLASGELAGHLGERTAQRIGEMCQVLRFPEQAPNLRTGKRAAGAA